MQFSPLLLTMAAPVVAQSAQATFSLVSEVGRSFADALSTGKSDKTDAAKSSNETIHEQLEKFAVGFRNWLQSNGVSSRFDVTLRSNPTDGYQLEASGPESEHISGLLEQNPAWKTELRQLVASFEALASVLAPGGGVGLSISDSESRVEWLSSRPFDKLNT
ncbi:MAG: hypothetical protein R3C53_10860 [Pirellulaceae bacterium]